MTKKKEYFVGVHVSIAGGFFNAIEEGTEIGCTAIQIFTKSNRQWQSKPITSDDKEKFITAQKNSEIKIVVAHASYLINLGSATIETQQKSFIALVDEIKRCQLLQIPFLVLHPGTAEQNNKELTLKFVGNQIDKALKETSDCNVTVLVETMAGQGKSIGSSFEELSTILDSVTIKKRIGVCFDTCHAFAAGYDFTTAQGYKNVFESFDKTIGLHFLKAFHMNDSKKELNSHVDRHESIGEGLINLEAFSMIMNDVRFMNIPKILETPKIDELENDKKNLKALINLIK
ncbi:deoxyribonuclease IV [Candidatus Babeliales bacterium]|nr:deoxyribonuclease IV [Candidatus Babeliales bacterium]MBP9843480.1 deoxyribonuclease IV [Candidatus Babeliales bacterium]